MRWLDSITSPMDMQTWGDSGEKRSLAGYSTHGGKELDTAQELNNNSKNYEGGILCVFGVKQIWI